MVLFDGSWHWYTIRESFKAQWKGTQNKSKIIQENLILKMLHFIYWNYRLRAGKQF
jgi:hypothetical protein